MVVVFRGLGFRLEGFWVQGLVFGVENLGFRGLGFRVSGFRVEA